MASHHTGSSPPYSVGESSHEQRGNIDHPTERGTPCKKLPGPEAAMLGGSSNLTEKPHARAPGLGEAPLWATPGQVLEKVGKKPLPFRSS